MTIHQVQEIIHRETENESIGFADPLSVIGDSLELLNVVGKIEAESGKVIPDTVLVKFETVGQLAEWVAA